MMGRGNNVAGSFAGLVIGIFGIFFVLVAGLAMALKEILESLFSPPPSIGRR